MSAATDAPDGEAVLVGPNPTPPFCPNPAMPLWSSHPRVFLIFGPTGEASCPYCGTRYRLAGGARPGHH